MPARYGAGYEPVLCRSEGAKRAAWEVRLQE
jgi:hypothetical protein